MEVLLNMVVPAAIGLVALFAFLDLSKKRKPREPEACNGDGRVVEVRLENGKIFYRIERFSARYLPGGLAGIWYPISQTRYASAGEARADLVELNGMREVSRRVIEEA